MNASAQTEWHPLLNDPSGCRRHADKPRTNGVTMIIDKGIGISAFEDMLQLAAEYLDIVKLGFGTAVLYPPELIRRKIRLAREYGLDIMPGGTLLEAAVAQNAVPAFFKQISQLGFNTIEVSDGTIEMDRRTRSELIDRGVNEGLKVVTEFGKKAWGSSVHWEEFSATMIADMERGAKLVTVEGRESGKGVGVFDADGECSDGEILQIVRSASKPDAILWETPLKAQQVHMLRLLGPAANLGNVAPEDILAVECLRRGLRSDTFQSKSVGLTAW